MATSPTPALGRSGCVSKPTPESTMCRRTSPCDSTRHCRAARRRRCRARGHAARTVARSRRRRAPTTLHLRCAAHPWHRAPGSQMISTGSRDARISSGTSASASWIAARRVVPPTITAGRGAFQRVPARKADSGAAVPPAPRQYRACAREARRNICNLISLPAIKSEASRPPPARALRAIRIDQALGSSIAQNRENQSARSVLRHTGVPRFDTRRRGAWASLRKSLLFEDAERARALQTSSVKCCESRMRF